LPVLKVATDRNRGRTSRPAALGRNVRQQRANGGATGTARGKSGARVQRPRGVSHFKCAPYRCGGGWRYPGGCKDDGSPRSSFMRVGTSRHTGVSTEATLATEKPESLQRSLWAPVRTRGLNARRRRISSQTAQRVLCAIAAATRPRGIVCIFDDDDLSAPGRVTDQVQRLKGHRQGRDRIRLDGLHERGRPGGNTAATSVTRSARRCASGGTGGSPIGFRPCRSARTASSSRKPAHTGLSRASTPAT
jgi:hypothetical protein